MVRLTTRTECTRPVLGPCCKFSWNALVYAPRISASFRHDLPWIVLQTETLAKRQKKLPATTARNRPAFVQEKFGSAKLGKRA